MIKKIFLPILTLYRTCISPLYPPCCRFYPSCSDYAGQAIRRHGAFSGVILAVFRVLRCNPLCKGGLDPVPENFGLKSLFGAKKTDG
ncbi:MAG: membrane protein insertion efficiency factor YidD [Desulfonatronovibrionaceae bacterium]